MSYTDFDFPHTSLYTSDLRELIADLRRLEDIVKTFVTTEQVKFADPIIWDITRQYQKTTIVLDASGNAYLSKQAVPTGIQLNNEDYWQEIFNFTEYTRTANSNLTVNIETNTTRATATYNIDDWLIWNDVLYKVTAAIAIDDTFIVAPAAGSNIIHFTVEDFIKAFITYATGLINQYKNDIDASELAYQTAMQAEVDRILAGATVDSEVIDARLGADDVNYPTLGAADRTQFQNVVNDIGATTENIVIRWYDKAFYNTNSAIDINTRTTHASFRCTNVPCVEGDKFTISCKSTSGAARIYAFIKSDGTIIEKGGVSQGNTGVTDFQLTAPAQSAYLILNDMAKNRDSFKNRLLYRKVGDIETSLNNLLPIPYREIEDSVITISDIDDLPSTTILNAGGQRLPTFKSSNSDVHVDIKLSATIRESANCRIMYYNGESFRNASDILPLEEGNNTKNFVIDCASLIQYEGAEYFALFFSGDLDITITEYAVTEHSQLESYSYYNKYFESMMGNVFSKLDSLEVSNFNTVLCTPNGNKKGLILTGENTLGLFNYIPNKMLIMGNSIVFGFSHGGESFGMAATRGIYDFANRVIKYIKTYNPNVVANKLYTSPFEHSTTLANAQQFITDHQNSWSSDLDLVIIQIGDNVNTADKQATFTQSFPLLIRTIRNSAPNARILIVGIWFNKVVVYNIMSKTAQKYGCELVDIRSLRSPETEGELGATVYFEDGYTTTVTPERVTHPGNLGMEYIADAIENVLNL